MRSRPKILSYSVSSPLVDALFSSFEVFLWKIKVGYNWEITEKRNCQFSISISSFQLVSGEEVLLYNKLSRQQVVFQTFWNERKSVHKNVKRFIHDWQRLDHVYFREEQCIFIIIISSHSHRNHCHNAQDRKTLKVKKYPNMLRYTERTGLMWGFRKFFQNFNFLGDFWGKCSFFSRILRFFSEFFLVA